MLLWWPGQTGALREVLDAESCSAACLQSRISTVPVQLWTVSLLVHEDPGFVCVKAQVGSNVPGYSHAPLHRRPCLWLLHTQHQSSPKRYQIELLQARQSRYHHQTAEAFAAQGHSHGHSLLSAAGLEHAVSNCLQATVCLNKHGPTKLCVVTIIDKKTSVQQSSSRQAADRPQAA